MAKGRQKGEVRKSCVDCFHLRCQQFFCNAKTGEPAVFAWCRRGHLPHVYKVTRAMRTMKIMRTAETCPDYSGEEEQEWQL